MAEISRKVLNAKWDMEEEKSSRGIAYNCDNNCPSIIVLRYCDHDISTHVTANISITQKSIH